jgi:hypothetical protein
VKARGYRLATEQCQGGVVLRVRATERDATWHPIAYTDEVANARIYAGFDYRFSTVAGRDMGEKIGSSVVNSLMLPTNAAKLE